MVMADEAWYRVVNVVLDNISKQHPPTAAVDAANAALKLGARLLLPLGSVLVYRSLLHRDQIKGAVFAYGKSDSTGRYEMHIADPNGSAFIDSDRIIKVVALPDDAPSIERMVAAGNDEVRGEDPWAIIDTA